MLAIKLKMVGRKNQRTFRMIVQEGRSKLDGNFVEDLGWYNPHTNQFKINKARVEHWVSNGAQPTETVSRILKKLENSEVQTYETRKGRKKKKAPKGEGKKSVPPEASTETPSDAEDGKAEAPREDTETPGASSSKDVAPDEPKEEVKEDTQPEEQKKESKEEPVEEEKEKE